MVLFIKVDYFVKNKDDVAITNIQKLFPNIRGLFVNTNIKNAKTRVKRSEKIIHYQFDDNINTESIYWKNNIEEKHIISFK